MGQKLICSLSLQSATTADARPFIALAKAQLGKNIPEANAQCLPHYAESHQRPENSLASSCLLQTKEIPRQGQNHVIKPNAQFMD